MRTCFEIEERDEYHAARSLLIRRCQDWARDNDRPADDTLLMSALDSRHFSRDGRLTYWTPEHVRHFLLEWIPRYMDGDPGDLDSAPEVLRTLLRFIRDYGLRDPRGASHDDNEAAIDAAARQYPPALEDVERFGVGKFWGRAAREHAVDPTDSQALARFQEDVHNGLIDIDESLLERLLVAQFSQPPLGEERTLAQLPVSLPSTEALSAAGADCLASARLTALVTWLGEEGRTVTGGGHLSAAESRSLAKAMGTGDLDLIETTSQDSPQLRLYLLWAKKMRLIRQYRGRLVPVRRATAMLGDPLALWHRAFDAVEELGDVICRPEPERPDTSMLKIVYRDTLPDVLNSLYSLPEAMPLPRLEETVWRHSCGAYFDIDELDPRERDRQHDLVCRDLHRIWDVLGQLGAVNIVTAVADEMFSDDLVGETGETESPFDPETTARLAAELTSPVPLIRLTDLATAVLRERMIAEGREAGLVGELAGAEADEMLSVVTQHYPPDSKLTEVNSWLSAHNTDIESLLNVARATPLRSRAAAILELLYDIDPGAPKLLRRMRSDPQLAPAALVCLVETGTLELMDLTEPERQLLTAESSLRLMEMDGPEAIIDGLEELPGVDARVVLDRVLRSGHPDTHALAEFRELVVTPLASREADRPRPPEVPPGRLGATRRARVRRGGRA